MMWSALTACFVVVLVVIVSAVIWAGASAAFQWGDWMNPLLVTAIFIVIQNLEALFYAPRIVGNYVGLHPMTVIVSIFVRGLIIGGMIGPLLAVPLTATVKVLFGRYIWGRRSRHEPSLIDAALTSEPVQVPAHPYPIEQCT